jgi:M-phase inducer tyrosine phosphatase
MTLSGPAQLLIPVPDFTADSCSRPISRWDSKDPFPSIDPQGLRTLMANSELLGYDLMVVIDGRFEYEHHGGHIRKSINIRSVAQLKDFFEDYRGCHACVVFHCEFSRNRGPTLMRAFRDYDRRMNEYPRLDFPDVFLLEGGYCRFYAECPDLCDGGYVPMRDDAFVTSGELKRTICSTPET